MQVFARFAKLDEEQRMVWGYASTEALDSQGEIVRRAAVAAALPGFMRWGNIREMHQPSAVGKAREAKVDERGLWLGARIVDGDAWAKVKEGVYTGFSIAGRVTARDPVRPNVITACDLSEISLVDRPANPEAVFTMFKNEEFEKEGRRHAAVDLARVQAIHDHARDLGADCAGHGPTMDGEFGDDEVAKSLLGRLDRRLAAIEARLDSVEALPAAPRGALRSIAKGEDLGGGAIETAGDVHSLIKASLRRPRAI
jgi:hypothetical protein